MRSIWDSVFEHLCKCFSFAPCLHFSNIHHTFAPLWKLGFYWFFTFFITRSSDGETEDEKLFKNLQRAVLSLPEVYSAKRSKKLYFPDVLLLHHLSLLICSKTFLRSSRTDRVSVVLRRYCWVERLYSRDLCNSFLLR